MKALVVSILLYSSTLWANSFEIEAVHLINGDVVSSEDNTYSAEEIRAIEIKDESQSSYLVTPATFDKIFGTRLRTRGAVRVGGDGSGGG